MYARRAIHLDEMRELVEDVLSLDQRKKCCPVKYETHEGYLLPGIEISTVTKHFVSGQDLHFLPRFVMSVTSSTSHDSSEHSNNLLVRGAKHLKCWSKGSENLQHKFCMAFTLDYTVYNFQIAYNEKRWFIQKRYSQFDKLDNVVSCDFRRVRSLVCCS